MSKAEIAVVVMGYICMFFICYAAWMNEPGRKGAAEFLGMWAAGALMCWVAQWLLARFILDHGSPNALLWSVVTGLLISATVSANITQPVQSSSKESSTGSVSA
jgi:hypothetical protein